MCRRLRKFSDAYVVMITARADEIDELMGLEIGADDFIRKPFSPRSVQARVTAVMRRHRPTPQRPTPRRRATDFMPAASTTGRARPLGAQLHSAGTPAPGAPGCSPPSCDPTAAPPPAAPPASAAALAGSADCRPASGHRHGFGLPDSDADGVLRHGPLVVEAEGRVASLDGVELELTRTEFDLLEALAGAPRGCGPARPS